MKEVSFSNWEVHQMKIHIEKNKNYNIVCFREASNI